MRTDWTHLEKFRTSPRGYESKPGDTFGWFVWLNGKTQLRAMAVDGTETGWEHVSVTVAYKSGKKWVERMPRWEEMRKVKAAAFWLPDECVVQFHPPERNYINLHQHCLHLWRNVRETFPTPPEILV